MADESRSASRSRPSGAASRNAPDLSAMETDPTMAPVTENTPLPPLTPLPLASQPAAGGAAPPPQPAGWPTQTDLPVLPPLPAAAFQPPAPNLAREAAQQRPGSGISTVWAAQSMFALMFTSVILLAAMAIAYAIVIKSGGLLIWAVVLIVALNLLYAGIVASIARPGSGQSFRVPFLNPRRGP